VFENGNVANRFGRSEVRMQFEYQEPFPLYYREILELPPTKLIVLHKEESLVVQALRNFYSEYNQINRAAGEK
jgi:hypothetical protein